MNLLLIIRCLFFSEFDLSCIKAQAYKQSLKPKQDFATCLDHGLMMIEAKTDSNVIAEYKNGKLTDFKETLEFDYYSHLCKFTLRAKRRLDSLYSYDSLKLEWSTFGKVDTTNFTRSKTSLTYQFKEISKPCRLLGKSFEEYDEQGNILPAMLYRYQCEYRKSKDDPCTVEGLFKK